MSETVSARQLALCRQIVEEPWAYPSMASVAREIVREADDDLAGDHDDDEADEVVAKLQREQFMFGNPRQAKAIALAGIKRGRELALATPAPSA